MRFGKRLYVMAGVVVLMMALGAGATFASGALSSSGTPGQIDDGAELLDQAAISLEDAIAAAMGAASGEIGEIDLETYQGTLVFNVDVGKVDVKVDAATGLVLGQERDDDGDDDNDDDRSDDD
jgi:hypothetical protein